MQENSGDLSQAVNAYYSEGCQNSYAIQSHYFYHLFLLKIYNFFFLCRVPVNIPLDDAMEIDDVIPAPLVIPIEVRDSTGPSDDAPTTTDHVTEPVHVQGPPTQGTVIVDDVPTRTSRQVTPAPNNNQDYNDIEEEMIQAAIEASKKESEVSFSKENCLYFCFFLVYLGLSI